LEHIYYWIPLKYTSDQNIVPQINFAKEKFIQNSLYHKYIKW